MKDSNILQQRDETFAENRTVDYMPAGGTVGSYRDRFTTTTVCRLQT
jgi:hypothetical protein